MSVLAQQIKSYFGIVSDVEIEKISTFFHKEYLKKDDFFLQKGQRVNKLSFIESGILRIFVHTDKKEVTQWISTAGTFVTDLTGFMYDDVSRWNIQALSDTVLYSISKEDYKKAGTMLSKWNEFEKTFIVKCFTKMEERIFCHLSMSSEERYHYFFGHNKELFNQVPLQYIASMLGMTPETFSRIRKK
ncbi:Crp/Fnr family transcriptional regulator [Sphingobacterium spiritivorum]|uniref:Crp/Fnr family transcriptional regulator n=1 Tax=Sphingobacterium spiritivorum TaxID=258 RepID=UPI003DA5FF26